MSHFSVIVIGEDIAEQLEPYNENTEVTAYQDGTAEDTLQTLEQGLNYFQNDATEKKYLGKTVETLTLEEKLEILDGWSGGEYRQDENGDLIRWSSYNPDSKWDWYEVGGRWSGYFFVKPGTEQNLYEPSRVHWSEAYQGEDSVDQSEVGTTKAPNLTDSALKKYIDFELMRTNAEIKALQRWEAFEEATKGLVSPGSWQSFARNIVGQKLWDADYRSLDEAGTRLRNERMDVARAEFGKNPFVQASRKLGYFDDVHSYFLLDDPEPKKAFVQRSINTSTTAWAVVKDGVWYAKGQMGWFGMSTGDVDEDEWDLKVNELINSLPEDTLLTMVDCHI